MRGCFVLLCVQFFFFFTQKTAYELRISDWSSDVCSSDLPARLLTQFAQRLIIETPSALPDRPFRKMFDADMTIGVPLEQRRLREDRQTSLERRQVGQHAGTADVATDI